MGSVPRPSSRRRAEPEVDPVLEADDPDDGGAASAASFRGRVPEVPEGADVPVELEGPEEEAALLSARCPAAEASSVGVISCLLLAIVGAWSAAPTGKGVGAAG